MSGIVESIYRATSHREPQRCVGSARLIIDEGLEGDRYANTAGGVVSLIEAEAVEEFNRATGLEIDPGDTGRNIVTRGIRLNPLVGKQFRIGDIQLEGIELCEPCATLGKRLATEAVDATRVVKAFVTSAGLRAIVRGTGIINPGTTITSS
ncbi:MAG: MOSC domain-containing protein [Gammaproteobacteria bacterium]|nr:MOSC domain-containing protein [Gammaproteobacteria bacterium]